MFLELEESAIHGRYRYMNNRIIFLTGNFASGKTTISRHIEKEYEYKRISGDEISLSLFPGEGIIVNGDKQDKYELILDTLFTEVESQFNSGNNLIVDYVIFKNEIEKYKNKYKSKIDIFVLLPDLEIALKRNFERSHFFENDKLRMKRIDEIFKKDKQSIGIGSFIDTSINPLSVTIEQIADMCGL